MIFFRRFRAYIIEKENVAANNFEIMRASLKVPDFSGCGKTEKTLTAVVAVACNDTSLLKAAKEIFGTVPIVLDPFDKMKSQHSIAELLHGAMKDALAVTYIASA